MFLNLYEEQKENVLLSFNERELPVLQSFGSQMNTGSLRWKTRPSVCSAQIGSYIFLVGTGARGRVVDKNPQNAGT